MNTEKLMGSSRWPAYSRATSGITASAIIWRTTRIETLDGEALRLSIGKPALLDTLRFVSDERLESPLGDDEVEVKVKATGLK
jgi:hypothetical protein